MVDQKRFFNKRARREEKHQNKLKAKEDRRVARHKRMSARESVAARQAYEAENPLVVYLISTPQYNEAIQEHLRVSDDYDLSANPVNFLDASDIWGAIDVVEAKGSIDVIILQACNSTEDPELGFGEITNFTGRIASSTYVAKGKPDYDLPEGITVGHMNDYGVLRKYLVEQRKNKTDLGMQ
jgi:hypothetical protein